MADVIKCNHCGAEQEKDFPENNFLKFRAVTPIAPEELVCFPCARDIIDMMYQDYKE